MATAKTSITLPTAVQDPNDAVVQLLEKVASDAQGQVAAADRLELLLKEKGLLCEASIAPRFLGFDPCNRDGQGGNPLNVLALASEIVTVGWSSGEVTKAICAEAVPGDRTIERFNHKLSADSGMAPVGANSIGYGTLACGHTNYVLRCIAASVPSNCEYLSEGGHMSLEKVRRRDLAYAEAVSSGLKWKVVKWQVHFLYPSALHFLQAARNVVSTMYHAESEMQGLLRLHAYSAAAMRENRDIPWDTIKKTIMRSKPAWSETFDDMVAFVVTRSGGIDGLFLNYLAAFCRNHVDSTRSSLPPALYLALAEFPLHYVALAIFQAAWRCPQESVINGQCRGITASEVTALANNSDPTV